MIESYKLANLEDLKLIYDDLRGRTEGLLTDTVFRTTLSRGRAEYTPVGVGSFAFGSGLTASGDYSHAEGAGTQATANYSHSEGAGTRATGNSAHAEGGGCQATGSYSHAEGSGCQATGESSHAEGGGSQASGGSAHAEGAGTQATYSCAHAEGSNSVASGGSSHAEGGSTSASESYAHAEGYMSAATGFASHAEGYDTGAYGGASHAEGSNTEATESSSHAEGSGTSARAYCSHVEGSGTIATGAFSHVFGINNCTDSYYRWEEWVSGETYLAGAKVKLNVYDDETGLTVEKAYICITPNSDVEFDDDKWEDQNNKMNFIEIVGNGYNDGNVSVNSNARALDWDGNEYLKGNLFVQCDYDGQNGKQVPHDIKINGVSILQNGVANIPRGNADNLGVFKTNSGYGVISNTNGELKLSSLSDAQIKGGTNDQKAVMPENQHKSAFYALAKLAGADMKDSNNPVGTYTDAALQGIQKLFGFANIFGPYEDDITADRAYAIGETFIMDGKRYKATAAITQGGIITPGTNCSLLPLDGDYVKKTDYATVNSAGIAKVSANYGTFMDNAIIGVSKATSTNMKEGTQQCKPIVPYNQHESVYYALAKLAGADMASVSGETVGVYPEAQKAAIQSMLGVSTGAILIENVSGTTPTITALPNVRYKCGEVSTLSITPPVSGSCEVIFTSGSTATLLTVPNTVKFPVWFDATALEADTIYDIIITDGVYGSVMTWAS